MASLGGSSGNAEAPRRVCLGGIRVDAVDLHEAMARIEQACGAKTPMQVVTLNIDFITLAGRIPAFRHVIDDSALVVADGRLLLWVSHLLGQPLPQQITGHDLMRECTALARARSLRMFLLGGSPGIADALARRLEADHSGLRAQGEDGGAFTTDGDNDGNAALVGRIRAFGPDLLFVALGAPKQEMWIARNLQATGASVAIGLGGVFDTLSGRLPRAPRWMQVMGMESLFQLAIAPRRYARRYLIDDPPTLARVAWRALIERVQQPRRSGGG